MKFSELKVGQEFKFNITDAVLHRVSVAVDANRVPSNKFYRNDNCIWPAGEAIYFGDVFTKKTVIVPEQVIPEHTKEEWGVF